MVTKQKFIDATTAANEGILSKIVKYDRDIEKMKEELKQLTAARAYLMEEAIYKKIERAGSYMLQCKPTSRRSVDLEAVKTLLTTDQILTICTITLKDVKQYLTEKQLAACTSVETKPGYKVIEIYEPGGKQA